MPDPINRLNAALEGRYRIERELGEGGMATVYLAEDLKHERKVAVKVLKPELAAVVGAERFLAEIKTTANLQHPHILPLFDSGEADSFLFYVMPYVEGESLRERIDREKQLPVDEAVAITTAVAQALQHAHDRGVIHRDIKPANILMQDGQPVVSDFGIALAVGAAGGGRLTETGLSLGTPSYMSPEQATGDQHVGPASDTYALGAVLYEMLTGDPPYTGSTAQAVLGKIIQGVPVSATEIRKTVPANVDAAIRKALERLAADRFTSANHFAQALNDASFATPHPLGAAAPGEGARSRVARAFWPLATAALAVAALFGWLQPTTEVADPVRFTIQVPDGYGMLSGYITQLVVAPDGRTIAFGSGGEIHVRALDDFESRRLEGTDGAQSIFFSPDGQRVGFLSPGGLKAIPVEGGVVIDIGGSEASNAEAAYWATDGSIVYASALGFGGIRVVAADGGTPEQLTTVDESAGESAHLFPQLLVDERVLLYTVIGPSWGWADARVVALDLDSGREVTVAEQGTHGRYQHDGYVAYANAEGTVFAVSFDLATFELGSPRPIATDVMVAYWNGGASFAFSGDGKTFAFFRGSTFERHRLVWIDREGRRSPPLGGALTVGSMRLSPDGRRVAMDIYERRGADIHISEVDDWNPRRFTLDIPQNESPVWSPDAGTLAYTIAGVGGSTAIVVHSLESGAGPVVIAERPNWLELVDWSPDGVWITFREATLGSNQDLHMVRADGSGEFRAVADGRSSESGGSISPDGKWIAYSSDETGRVEIYVDAFPELNARRQITSGGGQTPRWTGRNEISFVLRDSLFIQAVRLTPTLAPIGQPTALFRVPDVDFDFTYEVSPDGSRFLMKVPNPASLQKELHVVTGWSNELPGGVGSR